MAQSNRLQVTAKVPALERGLIIGFRSGSIVLTPAESVYLLVPTNAVELLYTKYRINLLDKEKRKQLNIWASLVEEREAPDTSALIETLLKTIELLTELLTSQENQITTTTLSAIDTQLQKVSYQINNPPIITMPSQMRIVYEIEKKQGVNDKNVSKR